MERASKQETEGDSGRAGQGLELRALGLTLSRRMNLLHFKYFLLDHFMTQTSLELMAWR
jgi:hypothetical protein